MHACTLRAQAGDAKTTTMYFLQIFQSLQSFAELIMPVKVVNDGTGSRTLLVGKTKEDDDDVQPPPDRKSGG